MQVGGILETALYVTDPAVAAEFYRRVFGFKTLLSSERLVALDVGGRSVLLLFKRGATNAPFATSGGMIPPHGGTGQCHFAFSIAADEFETWKAQLSASGVPIESTVDWPHGSRSLYFRDPDGHLGELITPGFWTIY